MEFRDIYFIFQYTYFNIYKFTNKKNTFFRFIFQFLFTLTGKEMN